MTYPVRIELEEEPLFPEYELQGNPFVGIDEESQLDALGSFWACAAVKEANRLWWEVLSRARADEPASLWLLRDENAAGTSNIGTLATLMHRLAMDEDAHFMQLYLPLPLAYADLMKGITRTAADRIIPTEFRKCFYAFATDQVSAAIDDPAAREELASFDDLQELATDLSDPKESGIHRFLFPTKKQRTEEQHKLSKPQLEDADDETLAQQEAEQQAERERIATEWEQRRALTAFLERRLRESDWGDGVPAGMRKVFETSAFTQARESLTEVADYRGNLAGLLKFLRHRYSRAIIFIDQIEAFGAFTETEKATFYGALAEFEVIGGSNAFWLLSSFPETVKLIGERRLAMFDMLPLDLSITREITAAPVPPEAFAKLVSQFLETDPLREESAAASGNGSGATFPFDAASVERVLAMEDGDSMRAVARLGRLLGAAAQAGKKEIDVPFAEEHAAQEAKAEAAEAAKDDPSRTGLPAD